MVRTEFGYSDFHGRSSTAQGEQSGRHCAPSLALVCQMGEDLERILARQLWTCVLQGPCWDSMQLNLLATQHHVALISTIKWLRSRWWSTVLLPSKPPTNCTLIKNTEISLVVDFFHFAKWASFQHIVNAYNLEILSNPVSMQALHDILMIGSEF